MNHYRANDARYTNHRNRMRMIGHLMLVRRILEAESAPAFESRYSRPRVINLQLESPMATDVLAWEAVAS